MRKFLRNMAKAKMKEMGYSKINKRMDHGRWREVVGAYPVNVVTGQEMSKSFCGKKKYQRGPGSLRHLFAY